MSEASNLPKAISHKKLSLLMLAAQKDKSIYSEEINHDDIEIEKFFDALNDFEKSSKEIIKKITSKNERFFEKKSSNSMMALGSMETHLNMALQALKVFKNDQN